MGTCVTLRSLKNPDAPANVLGFGVVPQRWYPLSLAAGLSLMGGCVQWDSFAAILFGHLYDAARIEHRLLPSCASVQAIERRLPQRLLQYGVLGGVWVPAGPSPPNPRRRETENARHQCNEPRNFQVFSGRGHRLGD